MLSGLGPKTISVMKNGYFMYLSHCYRACNIVTRQRETLTVHIDTGSSPVTNTYYIYYIYMAPLAQLVAHGSYVPVVQGSSP